VLWRLRAVLLALLAASSMLVVDGGSGPEEPVYAGVYVLTLFVLVPCALLSFVSAVVRWRTRRTALRDGAPVVVALAQASLAAWGTALVALFGGSLDTPGIDPGYLAGTYAFALAGLAAVWWIEDRVVSQRRNRVA